MVLTSKDIYYSIIHGAHTVIRNKETLNRINVFPVRDGDTGSNLSSMMQNIIREASLSQSIKKTLESVAESALFGARGNSGIIFASYFNGLSLAIEDQESISIGDYARASRKAAETAYQSIENPVEGTMITLMREWGSALLEESANNKSLGDIFHHAYTKIELALDKTKNQLDVLRKANVVDSGAKGFTYFIEGALYYIQTGEELDADLIIDEEEELFQAEVHSHGVQEKYRYCTECLFESQNFEQEHIKSFLGSLGDSTVVTSTKNKCRIHVHTNQPAQVFEFLHNEGRILYQKVDDMVHQKAIVEEKKSKIALITDSIADIEQDFIDEHQIHIMHLDILFKDRIYMDKLTVKAKGILNLAEESDQLPTSSQPSPKKIENLFNYLSTYYDSAIVLTVSKELSGTYNSFVQVANKFSQKGFKISVINSKQNSGAQGLLLKSCAELIEKLDGHDQVHGKNQFDEHNELHGKKQLDEHDEIVAAIKDEIPRSKILVQIKSLEHMIKSGRLSVKAGKIGRYIGMKPIVTLDEEGKGGLSAIAFSDKGSNKRILNHVKKLMKTRRIKVYSIVHIDNLQGAKELEKQLSSIIGYKASYITETSSIVAIGAGRGAVALSYILEKEGK